MCGSLRAQNVYNFSNRYTVGVSTNFVYFDKDLMGFKFYQKQLVVQKILTRKYSLIANYTTATNTSTFGFQNSPYFNVPTVDSLGKNPQMVTIRIAGTAIVRTSIINLGMRLYSKRKGAIAPYGRFWELKLGYATVKQKIEEDNFTYTGGYNTGGFQYVEKTFTKASLPDFGMTHLNILSLQAGYGVSTPIVKNFCFDWLMNFNLNIPLWSGSATKDTAVNYRDIYIYRNARILYGINNMVRLNLGVHYGF